MRQEKDFWTDRRVKSAVEMWKAGDNAKMIAESFGIRHTLVSSLVARRTDLFEPRRIKRAISAEDA